MEIYALNISKELPSSFYLKLRSVFIPLAFVSGVVGEVFQPFAITVVCAMLASLLVAVTIIPLLVKLL
ncbi:efflux RND transporter permease subunit [Virgibacillus sp. YIM 98842]|uniref:efflux RND transporter permease subunit n=1 Tax=Virgibacillus sp. YIM 98842 TaxID=2663533 RepID=UPI0013DB291C|nr:efflux RND transporter permease subunit [Virgibacillus sp. YIM 98842]